MGDSTKEATSGEDLMELLESRVGRPEGGTRSCPYPVNEAMIHHWCDAIGDRCASYLEPDFADASVHGGIVAPPTMLQAWTMPGLRPEEPSAGSAGTDPDEDTRSVMQILDDAGFTSVVATNCEQQYFRYLRPGDRITHTVEIESVSGEKKTALGTGHFVTQLYNYRDGNGELVAQMRFRLLKFRPPAADAPPPDGMDRGGTEQERDRA